LSAKRCWTAFKPLLVLPKPSTVLIFQPSHLKIGVMQELTLETISLWVAASTLVAVTKHAPQPA